ncbi:hypothetical protein [uncultured Psychromonas sp.]|uniref:hypothetical protein n=1 Tax=uncultured Psychromonas sp. TaxID=173974 RepID=UPI0026277DE3|nr:hypothetical protein [uncultured Psychromonas sp.]
MKSLKKILINVASLSLLIIPMMGSAHLMVAENGTLNFVDENVYVVLSLPISAFKGVDDDNDGHVSLKEFNEHRTEISANIMHNIYLSDVSNKFNIDGLLLNPTVSHENTTEIDELTIMGRYSLPTPDTKVSFSVKLFSGHKKLQHYDITATNKKQALHNKFQLNPTTPTTIVFKK